MRWEWVVLLFVFVPMWIIDLFLEPLQMLAALVIGLALGGVARLATR